MRKTIAIVAVVVVAVVVVTAGMFLLMKSGDDGGNGTPNGKAMVFNGVEYTWEQLESNFTARTVGDRTGMPLGDIMNSTAFSGVPSDDQNNTMFRITADDGWTKNVSWTDLQSGILLETDYMTYFPNLPGGFRVKNVASIGDVPLGPIMFLKEGGSMSDNRELTWARLSAALDEVTIQINTQDTQALNLAEVLEYAGFTGLESATLTIEGVDGYSRFVNWTLVQDGYLVEDGMRSYFEGLPGSYRIRNVIRIWIEY